MKFQYYWERCAYSKGVPHLVMSLEFYPANYAWKVWQTILVENRRGCSSYLTLMQLKAANLAVLERAKGQQGTAGQLWFRLGVKLDCKLLNTRRTRGVRFSASFPCREGLNGNILASFEIFWCSTFLPMTTLVVRSKAAARSGVRALNTGTRSSLLHSGVFGFGKDDGPDTTDVGGVVGGVGSDEV